ncbi:MAG TPA: cytochrome oxidase small assembly protein [Burkholderiales bacterium]|nr:cytochrome oxidase small assembly protein [Burkholderiales bacterium]
MSRNARTALILASIALVGFLGVILKYWVMSA